MKNDAKNWLRRMTGRKSPHERLRSIVEKDTKESGKCVEEDCPKKGMKRVRRLGGEVEFMCKTHAATTLGVSEDAFSSTPKCAWERAEL